MNEIFLNYEVELESITNIRLVEFPHNREGFILAMELIESLRKDLISASIVSPRDGIIYNYNSPEEERTLNYNEYY